MHDRKTGRISREDAVAVIKAGGSVSIGPRIYTSVDTLPNAAEFAKGDPAAVNRARKQLEEQRDKLNTEIANIGSPPEKGSSQESATAISGSEPLVSDGLDGMSRKDLLAMADEEGVDYPPNIGDEKLRQKIRDARAANSEGPQGTSTSDKEE